MTKASNLSQLGEFGLINRIKRQLTPSKSVRLGIGDDAAVTELSQTQYQLLTTDMLREGVHFTKKISAKDIGYKAMAASVSDIAAMGGIPKYAVVSLGISPSASIKKVDDLYAGMKRVCQAFQFEIVGGDTVQSDSLIINVTLTGVVDKKHLVTRSKAKAGDIVFVSGPLGRSYKSGHHYRFTPRVKEAQYLVRNFKPSAMIDCSDGLAQDLGHILSLSKVGALLEESVIPKRSQAKIEEVLFDGEDFELIFTLSPTHAQKLVDKRNCKYPFYPIGEVVQKDEGFKLITQNGELRNVKDKGFSHF